MRCCLCILLDNMKTNAEKPREIGKPCNTVLEEKWELALE